MDNLTNIDRRQAALRAELDIPSRNASGSAAAMLVQVYDGGHLPVTHGVFYACRPCSAYGSEVENGTCVVTPDSTKTVMVFVLGSRAALPGDVMVARLRNSYWYAERMTKHVPIGITLHGCPCDNIPQTLHLTSSKPDSNLGIFQNATLVYGPTPPEYNALALGTSCYLSTESYPDDSTGDLFRYYFGCYNGYYGITRVYAVSFYGSPYLDVVRYRWLVGLPGNTCGDPGATPPVPFGLANGRIFVGGDATCIVTVMT